MFAVHRMAPINPGPGPAEFEQGRLLGAAVVDVKTLLDISGTLPSGVRHELGRY